MKTLLSFAASVLFTCVALSGCGVSEEAPAAPVQASEEVPDIAGMIATRMEEEHGCRFERNGDREYTLIGCE